MTGISKQTLNNWRRKGIILYKKLSPKIFLYQFPENEIIKENEEKIWRGESSKKIYKMES